MAEPRLQNSILVRVRLDLFLPLGHAHRGAGSQAAGVEVEWKPFLLGPIFKAQGWNTSPFNLYPAKGRYMVRDIARLAAARGIAFRLPEPFPSNTLTAARLALIGMGEGWVAPFSRAVFEAPSSRDGLDIASITVLGTIRRPGLHLDSRLP